MQNILLMLPESQNRQQKIMIHSEIISKIHQDHMGNQDGSIFTQVSIQQNIMAGCYFTSSGSKGAAGAKMRKYTR